MRDVFRLCGAALAPVVLSGLTLLAADVVFQSQESGTASTLRGVSAVDARVCWASGTKGTYLRTTDGGAHWEARVVPGAEELDFRDVEAVDANTAYLLSIGPGERSRVYKTLDGGAHWTLQFSNPDTKGFFDGFAFWDAKHGILFGDPVDGRFVIAITQDGKTWRKLEPQMPPAIENEGAFAASGTSIAAGAKGEVWFATGGASKARVFHSTDSGMHWTVAEVPVKNSDQMSGVFGLAFSGGKGIAVGGNDKLVDDTGGNLARIDGQGAWQATQGATPSGFRSAVAFVPQHAGLLVTVGRNGADVSEDGGASWRNASHTGYHAVSFGKRAPVGWAVGDKGRIARITIP